MYILEMATNYFGYLINLLIIIMIIITDIIFFIYKM